jgi:hypothetical protein
MLVCVGWMLCVGGRAGGENGYTIRISPGQRVYSFLASLPIDSMIAGWPDGVMDNVPLLSRRSALITLETQQAFHQRYADEMRRRFKALAAAYYAENVAALRQLHDEFGVTHLVIDKTYLANPPPYAQPFDQWARVARQSLGSAEPAVLHQPERAVVFRQGDLFVLDLRKID